MTPEQVSLVRASFAKIAPIAPAAAGLFYDRLFSLDPKLRDLFTGDMAEQGRKLMAMIATAVAGLDRPDDLGPALRAMGARHARYGVRDADYGTVAGALLWTLEQGLGDSFTLETREAWTACYISIAAQMQAGAAGQSEVA